MSYFDLNVPWPAALPQNVGSSNSKKKQASQDTSVSNQPNGVELLTPAARQEVVQLLQMLIHLGYSICALNLSVPATTVFPAQIIKQYNPCFDYKAPFPELDKRQKGKGKDVGQDGKILQLSRLTLAMDEATVKAGGGGLTNSNAGLFAQYDILSVLPLDNFAFTHACQSLISPSPISIDIITLDLASSPRLPFLLKRSLVLSAIKAGVAFEVVYAPTVASTGYSKEARRNVFAGVRELVRVTNGGKGVLLSSSARQVMELRSPSDLTSLAELLGCKPDWAKAAVSDLARSVVARGFSNRQTFRGLIKGPEVESIVQTSLQDPTTAASAKKRAVATESESVMQLDAKETQAGEVEPRAEDHDGKSNKKRRKM